MNKHELSVQLLALKRCYIVGHVRPDGDCIGSELALAAILRTHGVHCEIVKNDPWGRILEPFFLGQSVVSPEEMDASVPLVCVDCSDFKRTGDVVLSKYEQPDVVIDHHLSNAGFGKYNYVDPSAASTTELLSDWLIAEQFPISAQVANWLYLGIMTDTNRFAYRSTTSKTLDIVRMLLERGADMSLSYQAIYERDTVERYRLLERLLHRMDIFEEGRCCLSYVEEKDFKETGAKYLETEGFVNYTRNLDGVEIGSYLEFHSDYVKCSIRSRSADYRMDLFAKKFGGGGHPAASGCTVYHYSSHFYQEYKSALAEHLKNFYRHERD